VELRPHQEKALQELRDGSVLAGGVGVGKTITALAYYVQIVCGGFLDRSEPMRHPRDLVVITTAKKRDSLDWEREGLKLGLSVDPDLSYSGREFVIDSWNNMKRYVDREDCFFVFDEQRLVGAGAWVKSFLKIVKRNQWILLSATPADTWMDYVPLFIAHGFYRNRTDFVEQHVIWSFNGKYRKIRGFFGVRHLERQRDSILVHMPYKRHTSRHLVAVPVDYDREAFDTVWKRRWNIYEGRPLVDVAEMHRVARRLVNTDVSRMDAVVELGRKHPRMIVYYTHDYELEDLRTLMTKMDIPVAEWNGHRHEEIPGTDRWLYLVQYQAGSEAWETTATDTTVYYSLTYSHKLFEQSQGRTDRLHTPYDDLWYYILMSDSRIDNLIWKALVAKKNFHEGRNVRFDQATPENALV